MNRDPNPVPAPRPSDISTSSTFTRRRPSLTLSPHLANTQPIPIPSRHGTISNRSPRSAHETLSSSSSLRRRSKGSFSSLSLSGSLTLGSALLSRSSDVFGEEEDIEVDRGEWLDITARDLLIDAQEKVIQINADVRVEEAVNTLLEKDTNYLFVNDAQPAFFDYADLNAFLLLVLDSKSCHDTSGPVSHDRFTEIVTALRSGTRLSVGAMCNISGKNPYHTISPDAPLRSFIHLYGKGVHRVSVEGGGVLSHESVLRYLLCLPENRAPSVLQAHIDSSILNLSLHPLISISSSSSILDAMRAMRKHGLRVLGVLAEERRIPPSSHSSPLLSPVDDRDGRLISVVRARECARIVIPSEGKQALTMSLANLVKLVEGEETAGKERGEERMPIHTLPPSTTLIYACHLILATSSSRVFIRTDTPPSPLTSPAHETSFLLIPVQLSPHCVLSIVDVFKCLVRIYT